MSRAATRLLAQLESWYGYDGLAPSTRTIVMVRLAPDAVAGTNRLALSLEAPPGVRVETPCVWAPSLREGAWRIVAERPGEYDLRLVLGGDAVTKRITVSRSVAARAPLRPRAGMWDEFLNPAESPLSASSRIESIEVRYPPRSLDAFGLSSSWLVVFLVLTTVFMLIGRPLVNVVM